MKRVRWKSKGGVNIMKHSLEVKSQSIEASGITKDYKEALVEYIWNGFEANAGDGHGLNQLGAAVV